VPEGNPLFAALQASLEKDTAQPAIRKHLASLLIDAGDYEAAIPHLTRLSTETPDDGEVGSMLGRCYRKMADRYDAGATEPPQRDEEDRLGPQRQRTFDDGDDQDQEHVREGAVDSDLGSHESPPGVASDIRLTDVAGLAAVKTRLENSFLKPFRNPELQKAYGVTGRGGLLLYGPPGCGKTYIARAIAGELMARFYAINVLDIASPYFGQSENRLFDLLQMVRRNRPSVVFFDEVDALGRKRSLTRESDRSITTVLLEQMDGLGGDNEGMFFIAATNHPWDVDVALRRPGRFDRTLFVAPPDGVAREAILRQNLRDRPSAGIDFDYLAAKSDRFSGADVKHLVTTAAEYALLDAIDDNDAQPIEMKHFKKALSEVKPSIRGWLESAKNYALFANDGGQYDDLALYLQEHKVI
jgi:AAA+ superfamily predicted ATPase